jgi:virginiamycin B lyase
MKWQKIVLAGAVLFLVSTAALAALKQFRTPTANSQPRHITLGPDGNMWFTESDFNVSQIARVNPNGKITEFVVPTRFSQPSDIVAGPDGALWFTEPSGPAIGRVTTAGRFMEFFPPDNGVVPDSIAVGPDGNLWFTDLQNRIWKLTTNGIFTEFLLVGDIDPNGITAGPDGAMWFAEFHANALGRIDPKTGAIQEFGGLANGPQRIALGPDGNLWFTEPFANLIGRMTVTGSLTEFPLPTANALPQDIVAGPDGNLWFTEFNAGQLAKITTAGVITEVQKVRNGPFGIGTDHVSGIWLTEMNGDRVAVFTVGP